MVPNNTSVLLIYTGGTIGMIENTETGALENFNFEHLQKHVPELQNFTFRIDTYQSTLPWTLRTWIRMPGANSYASSATTTNGTPALSSFMERTPWPTQHLPQLHAPKGSTSPSSSPVAASHRRAPYGRQGEPADEYRDRHSAASRRTSLCTGSVHLFRESPDARQPHHQNQCRKLQRFPFVQLSGTRLRRHTHQI